MLDLEGGILKGIPKHGLTGAIGAQTQTPEPFSRKLLRINLPLEYIYTKVSVWLCMVF